MLQNENKLRTVGKHCPVYFFIISTQRQKVTARQLPTVANRDPRRHSARIPIPRFLYRALPNKRQTSFVIKRAVGGYQFIPRSRNVECEGSPENRARAQSVSPCCQCQPRASDVSRSSSGITTGDVIMTIMTQRRVLISRK